MTALLIIIYVCFISLGLPDSLLGGAWPSMYEAFGVPIASAGIASMIIAGGTIVSSLFSDRLIRRFGVARVTVISVAMTALALLGMSLAGSFPVLCLLAIPLGLGAGSVDAALNNFVALHYNASHMSWLHCFWGIGASLGPVILSASLAGPGGYQAGYRTVGLIQLGLSLALVISLPLWRRAPSPGVANAAAGEDGKGRRGLRNVLSMPGAKSTLTAFFCYCAIETTTGLWGSTFLVTARGIATDTAAGYISLFYIGITAGRLLSGVLAARLSFAPMLRLGQGLIAIGAAVLMLPISGPAMLCGLFLIGLGCAPIYPTLLHETPMTFGRENSQAMMGVQMATAYVGSTVMPPLFGLIGGKLGYSLLPYCVAALLLLMAAMVQWLIVRVKRPGRA